VITFGLNHVALRASATPIPGGGEWSVLLVLTDLTTVQRFEQLRRDFVSSVSHELRTPLAAIKVMVETVDEGNADPAEAAEFIARTRSEVDRMVALVNDLLDLSRIEAGVVPITMARVDVRGAAEAAARLFEQVTAARGVAISLPPGGVVAWADQEALVHVLTNLIDNAIKFGPPSAPVNVDAHEEDGRVVIEVRDSGPGIEPADLERVFQRFYKADDSRSQAGTGLGLAIVKHLVLAQGGTVEASSGGDGAVFTVRLAQPPEVEAQAAPGR
jgi:two-component system phosphate regulon sensor histidine kinase PhoR